MNSIKSLCAAVAILIATNCFAQDSKAILPSGSAPMEGRAICVGATVSDTSKILSNPGSCSVEFLRRLGRGLAKLWPEDKKTLKSGLVLLKEFAGTAKFVKNLKEKDFSPAQAKEFDSLLSRYSADFEELSGSFDAAPESITFKTAVEVSEVKKTFIDIIENNGASSTISIEERSKMKEALYPIFEGLSDIYSLMSISEKGIYGRTNLEAKKGGFSEIMPVTGLTMGEYVDEQPLFLLAQTHKVYDFDVAMKKIRAIPSSSVVFQLLASAGIDLEKDVLANYATESVLYVNLTPTGEWLLPDIRFVAMIPEPERFIATLPKFKELCVLTGIFINNADSGIKGVDLAKLSHFMIPNYGVYTALVDRFCIMGSTKEGAIEAINQIKKPTKVTNAEKLKPYSMYCRIRTEKLNAQLQQFLQSPLMTGKGIPPISNLTFLNDIKTIELTIKSSDKKIEMTLDMPFFVKNK